MSHKDLFPLDSNDCIGSLIIFVGLVIATSGGIGGGGIIVPVLLLFFHFDSRHAIPLSNITIFGASIVNLLFNARRQHPLKKESLIDWDAVLVMEPLTMIGKRRRLILIFSSICLTSLAEVKNSLRNSRSRWILIYCRRDSRISLESPVAQLVDFELFGHHPPVSCTKAVVERYCFSCFIIF